MVNKLDAALERASEGFWVFPVAPNSKIPWIDGWQRRASRDPEVIRRWWTCPVLGTIQDFNIGISTSRFGDDQALCVVDVDNKGDKHGDDELLRLELSGCDFPPTFEAITASGGRHLVYVVDKPLRQGANVLATGLDIRSRGGFVIGVGSTLDGRAYVRNGVCSRPARAPAWLVDKLADTHPVGPVGVHAAPHAVNPDRAALRAIEYLASHAPLAVEGQGGDQTTFQVAARLKDFGVDEAQAQVLMSHWNERCTPPWSTDELHRKIANAYRYGKEAPGAAAPEVQFAPVSTESGQSKSVDKIDTATGDAHPFDVLNRNHAFVIAGGGYHILWETADEHARFRLEHLAPSAFHARHAAWTMQIGKKNSPVTELWISDKRRRGYDGICFLPGRDAPAAFYNLWRGFAVEPQPAGVPPSREADAALTAFLDHAKVNVCRGDEKLFNWLIGYFAHMAQKPWDKPLVALVFRGGKGVGKNALVETIGNLLGSHFLLTSNRRYLVGNFNGHLENLLLFVLDEAFWSGDKQAEGTLKDLITGKTHVIEHKGKEPFTIDNRTRIAIIGNEDWIVPASHDERRFAVFDVGDGRKQDRVYFQAMREGMERGGYALLLRYLLDYKLDGLDFNEAPQTSGLLEQKHASLDALYQWWLECITEGQIVGSDFGAAWPQEIETERFRSAFRRYSKDRNIRSRFPDSRAIGRLLKHCAPTMVKHRVRTDEGLPYTYRLPTLDEARASWEKFIGHPVEWE